MVVQVVFAGSQILTNLALKQEGFLPALLMYRHLIASACIAPMAIIFDREGMSDLKKPHVCIWVFLTSLCGTEALQISTLSLKLKVLGTVLCVGGAVIISFYDGPSLIISRNNPHQKPLNPTHFLRGTLLLIASCFEYAIWFVVQDYIGAFREIVKCETLWY
ncbi:WAT1-related protein At2g37450-like [Silene latifolia]|uniref:WAT1-related protein At2g37450-like n=1 Tax=Silene latifolia TaxID=37657 RepID=UPI003D784540